MSEVALFDVEPGIPPERTKARVAKTFRRFEPDQVLFLPPSLDEWLQLGVRPDLGFGRLEVVPQLPPGQDHIAASNILVGAGTVGVTAMHRATTYTTVVDARVRARLTLGVTLPADARIRTVQLNGGDVRSVVRLTHRGREVLVPAATGTAQRLVVRTG